MKNKVFEYQQFDIQFPTERENNGIEVLSKSNQRKIMNYVQEHFTFKNLGIYICLSAGIRIGEICALTWNEINTDMGVIHIRKTIQRIYIIDDSTWETDQFLVNSYVGCKVVRPLSRDGVPY